MKLARASGMLGLVALAVIGSPFAMAQDSGWYVGANAGQSRAKIDDERITSSLAGRGLSGISIADDDRDTGYKIYGGYKINKNFAVEGGYFDLGEFGYAATTSTGTLNGNSKIKGLNLDLIGMLPITEKFSAFGRVGVNYADVKDSFTGTEASVYGANANPSERAANLKVGLGLQYAFTESLAMRAEVERYRINDAVGNKGDIDLVSLGLLYQFGGAKAAPAAITEMPEPVAVAAAPAPVVAQPAPVPVSEKVTFAAETLFDFDKSVVKPEGKAALDDLLRKLEGMDAEVMITVGHADATGSDAYNQKLSVRRAEAVKAYMVSTGVDAKRVYTEGKGEAQPIADNKTAEGRAQNRRVTVEVVGSRTVMQ
ncbi:MAG: OmpA family protein [Burkholderiaceae bacterium]